MKSSRNGRERLRIKSARNMTVPLSSETTTISRPVKSRAMSRDRSRMRRASWRSVIKMRSTSLRQRGGTPLRVRAGSAREDCLMSGILPHHLGLPRNFLAQFQFHEHRAGVRIVIVSFDGAEAQRSIKRYGFFHRGEGIQTHV